MHQRRLITLILLLLLSFTGMAYAGETKADDACAAIPLLDRYERAGLLSRSGDGELQLRLVADLHAADCGAPDCYGTHIVVTMKPAAKGSQCILQTAVIQTQDFAGENCGGYGAAPLPTTESYMVSKGEADLSNKSLKRVTLRNSDRSRALVLMRQNFFYFDHVTADGVLHAELPTEDEKGCCWGVSSSESHFSKANRP